MPDDLPREDDVALEHPSYAARFKCIGPECEDICCTEWDIPVDKKTYESYTLFPVEKLGREVAEFVAIEPGVQPDALFARIRRGSSGVCPFLDRNRLCQIQANYGQQLLPSACSIYPRSLSLVGGQMEGSLSLSCPEAARNVLLDPEFIKRAGDLYSGEFRTDNVFSLAGRALADGSEADYFAIRRQLVAAIRDRSRSLRYRVLCVGDFCRELDAARSPSDMAAALRGLAERVPRADEGWYGAGDTGLKLRTVLDLSEARMSEGCGSRFEEAFLWFAQGLSGSGCEGSTDSLRFDCAEREFYGPYLDKHPYIFENYLLNFMFLNLFPFGRQGSADFIRRNAWGEYVQVAIQLAWVQALLIGAAGFFKEDFGSKHVMQVVQSLARTVEHYPQVLVSMDTYLRVHKLDSMNGIAALL